MEVEKWIKEKGIFIKIRIGKKPFNPALPEKEKTTVWQDVSKKRKEKETDEKGTRGVVRDGGIMYYNFGNGTRL